MVRIIIPEKAKFNVFSSIYKKGIVYIYCVLLNLILGHVNPF